jgi:hypothetical protein
MRGPSGDHVGSLIGSGESRARDVPRASDVLGDGDLVTVDGHLGIVTGAATDFELEEAFGTSTG